MTISYIRRLRLIGRDAWLAMPTRATHQLSWYGVSAVTLNLYLLRLGYGPEFIGLLYSVGALSYALLSPLIGVLARRRSGRSMMIIGKAVEVLGYLPMTLAAGPWRSAWILGGVVVMGLGAAIALVNYAPYLVAVTGVAERDQAFAASAAIVPLAGVAGSLLGGVLPGVFAATLGMAQADPAPYRYTVLLGGLLELVAIPLMLRARDVPAPQAAPTGGERASRFPMGIIGVAVLVVALMWVPYGMVNIFLNVYMDRSLEAPSALIGAWLAVGQALMVLGALTIPWWVRRWGRFGSIVATLGIPALGFVLLALVPQVTVAGASQALAKAAAGIAMTILTVYGLEAVAPEWRTMMSGAMNLAVGFGYSAIALVGGYVIVGWGYAALFVGGVAAAAASSVLFWAYFRVPRGEHRLTPAPAP